MVYLQLGWFCKSVFWAAKQKHVVQHVGFVHNSLDFWRPSIFEENMFRLKCEVWPGDDLQNKTFAKFTVIFGAFNVCQLFNPISFYALNLAIFLVLSFYSIVFFLLHLAYGHAWFLFHFIVLTSIHACQIHVNNFNPAGLIQLRNKIFHDWCEHVFMIFRKNGGTQKCSHFQKTNNIFFVEVCHGWYDAKKKIRICQHDFMFVWAKFQIYWRIEKRSNQSLTVNRCLHIVQRANDDGGDGTKSSCIAPHKP